jgi:hypothetical protein
VNRGATLGDPVGGAGQRLGRGDDDRPRLQLVAAVGVEGEQAQVVVPEVEAVLGPEAGALAAVAGAFEAAVDSLVIERRLEVGAAIDRHRELGAGAPQGAVGGHGTEDRVRAAPGVEGEAEEAALGAPGGRQVELVRPAAQALGGNRQPPQAAPRPRNPQLQPALV